MGTTIKNEKNKLKKQYLKIKLRDKNLVEWAIIWFKTSNDLFFELYGFNFNPHEYKYLYEIAREEVFKN